MKASRLLMKEESLAIVELVFDVPGGNVPGDDTLMMECIHTANRTVLGRVIEGRTPVREIRWDLEATESDCSKVGLSVGRKPGRYLVSPAYWPILNPPTCLGRLHSWMEGANPGPETLEGGENLFELWETDAGLVCWVRGQKYKLMPLEAQGPPDAAPNSRGTHPSSRDSAAITCASSSEAQGPPDAAPNSRGTHPSSRDSAAITCASSLEEKRS